LRVFLARHHGFCSGVKQAVELAEKVAQEARETGGTVWTLGPLIHNRRVVAGLEALGVRTATALDDIPPGDTLILPSHGAPPVFYEQAEARGLKVVDATCPLVRKVQKTARELRERGYDLVLVGEPQHTEVEGVVGWAGGDGVRVIETVDEARALPAMGKAAVVSQTTQRPEDVRRIADVVREKSGEVRLRPTLCPVTSDRQKEARELAERVDVLIVVGGRESANTRRLVDVGREMGRRVHQVENYEEIDPSWFRPGDVVGVAAGTSTPDWITEEVVARMKEIEPNTEPEETKKVAAPPEASPERGATSPAGPEGPAEPGNGPAPEGGPSSPDGDGEKAVSQENALTVPGTFEPGARVTGTVVKVSPTEALLDIGHKSEAVMPLSEISRQKISSPEEVLKEGQVVEALVVRLDDEGHPILSRKRIEEEEAWKRLAEARDQNLTIEAPVTALVKGGLVANVGTRGFIPASQVGLGFIQDLSQYVGRTLKVKVLEVDRGERKVILSEKQHLEEEQSRAKEELLGSLTEGETRTGEVRRVADYGAFVDIGGIDGLLHVSEMSWRRVKDPREIVKEGDRVEVRVLKVDRERGRVSLGLKQVEGDPWADVPKRFPVGSLVSGKVVSVADFGAFVELDDGVEGLVHVSQLSDKRVGHPSDLVKVGDELRVKVLKVNPAERRISLSARGAEEEMDRREIRKFLRDANEGAAVTIGDLVGDVFRDAGLGERKNAGSRKKN